MLTPIINAVLALTLTVSMAFGSLFTASSSIGQVTVVPGSEAVTVEPVQPADPQQPDTSAITAAPATEGEYTDIQRGQSGEAVLALQERLSELGYYTGKLTGKMDSPTQLAYKKFETTNGFHANGVASPEEQMVLFSEAAIAAE